MTSPACISAKAPGRPPLLPAALLAMLLTACNENLPPTQSGRARELATAFSTLGAGFQEYTVGGLANPTALDVAPDGRVFVCEQAGKLRVIKNGVLLPAPFLALANTGLDGERGLLGVALDPDFPSSPYVYLYYTCLNAPIHNRVSRFTVSAANPDVGDAASEQVLFELDNLSAATNHNSGAIHFGPDGKLYVAAGENANSLNAQSFTTVLGKLLRINKDGSIPADNPFYAATAGNNRAIWALGLRNPFTFAFQPSTGRLFINDVGANTWEEIDDGKAGGNYGWPDAEGPSTDPRYLAPFYAYGHGSLGCAITGAAFYNPVTAMFPPEYAGNYFYCDYCAGYINRMDVATGQVSTFASGLSNPVNLRVADDGSLYYAAWGNGTVGRIVYTTSQAPYISQQPGNLLVTLGEPAAFAVTATGAAPLHYQWQRNDADIAGAAAASYVIPSAQLSDSGVRYRCVVSNAQGVATGAEATLYVTTDRPPVPTIVNPPLGATYVAGQSVFGSGTAVDPEDGALPASAFTWVIVFHHETHTHPFVGPISGATAGSVVIPDQGETSSDVWYRIHLYVHDSKGRVDSAYRDVLPRKVDVMLASNPPGLQLQLDGQPITAPLTVTGVVGMQRMLGAPSPQTLNGRTYRFVSWSDGGAQTHAVATPPIAAACTALYQ